MSQPLHNPGVPPANPPASGPGTPPAQQPPAGPGQFSAGGGSFSGGNQGPGVSAPGSGQPPQQGEQGDPSQLGDPGLRALNAEREAARQARQQAAQLQQQLDAISRQNMSDAQRAQAEAADWRQKYEAEMVQRLRLDAAMRHNVASEDMVLLTGSSPEELEAQAARLAQIRAQQWPGQPVPPAGGATPPPAQYPGGATPPPPQYYPQQPPQYPVQRPPWVPNPGQQAGNAPTPPTATVQAGRDRYQQKHGKTPTA